VEEEDLAEATVDRMEVDMAVVTEEVMEVAIEVRYCQLRIREIKKVLLLGRPAVVVVR
jgi:hypothetical protein